MKNILLTSLFVMIITCGCIGPSILSSRSQIEFYHVTTDGHIQKEAQSSPITISAEKQYDATASLSTGNGSANAQKDDQKKESSASTETNQVK